MACIFQVECTREDLTRTPTPTPTLTLTPTPTPTRSSACARTSRRRVSSCRLSAPPSSADELEAQGARAGPRQAHAHGDLKTDDRQTTGSKPLTDRQTDDRQTSRQMTDRQMTDRQAGRWQTVGRQIRCRSGGADRRTCPPPDGLSVELAARAGLGPWTQHGCRARAG